MKKTNGFILGLLLVSLLAASCGWKPSVTAVPITTPWSDLHLPVDKDAVVWESTPTRLKVAHKDDRKTVADAYKKALEASGLKMTKFEPTSNSEFFTFEDNNGVKLQLESYDFENSGIIIEIK